MCRYSPGYSLLFAFFCLLIGIIYDWLHFSLLLTDSTVIILLMGNEPSNIIMALKICNMYDFFLFDSSAS